MLRRVTNVIGIFMVACLIAVALQQSNLPSENETVFEEDDFPMMADPGPESTIEPKYKSSEFQAGMNVLIYGHAGRSDARKMFQHLRKLGINSIAITFPFYQANLKANAVVQAHPEFTPTVSELREIIEEANAEDLSVMMRPILDEKNLMDSGHWRGQIKPTDPQAWFDSYRSLLLTYAKLAEANDVAVFNIGTELNSLQVRHEWIKLIEDLRSVYTGKLTYSFNWDVVHKIPDYEFVKLLDYVGVDAYFPLDAPDGASVAELENEWKKWTDELKTLFTDKPILVTEAGVIPVVGVHRHPYVWSIPGGKLDRQAQANYYEATFKALRPLSEGIYWWAVTLEKNPDVVDYSPLNSPTESVIKQHFLKTDEDPQAIN